MTASRTVTSPTVWMNAPRRNDSVTMKSNVIDSQPHRQEMGRNQQQDHDGEQQCAQADGGPGLCHAGEAHARRLDRRCQVQDMRVRIDRGCPA